MQGVPGRCPLDYTVPMQEWIIAVPQRLDTFLAADGRTISRGKARIAIEGGLVMVNDETVTKPSYRLEIDDNVKLLPSPDRLSSERIKPMNLHLNVLFEDDNCFVIEKPANLAVHPGAGMKEDEPTVLHGIAHLFKERTLTFSPDSVLVHRLDQETTGCLLVAKTAEAHLALQKQFEDRTVEKRYLAIVFGMPQHRTAVIDAPIGRSAGDRTKMSVLGASGTREARTTYDTLASANKASLLLCTLHTGRTHQLRVHLKTIGHPILGDTVYSNASSADHSHRKHITALCLHAWNLSFTPPGAKKNVMVQAPLSQTFVDAMAELGLPLDALPSLQVAAPTRKRKS